jgi:cellulose synthase/poly-beta-1,6-N-acetylglucosamine synthase-like glycosyltransferase
MIFILLHGLNLLLGIASWILLAMCFLLLLETLVFVLGDRQGKRANQFIASTTRAAIIIPAHDEALGLRATLEPLLNLPYQVIVVADNCHDQTASIARSLGVTVLERDDEVRRGKGYAMDFGLDFLAMTQPAEQMEVVVFLDADCLVSRADVIRLVEQVKIQQRPIQAKYLMLAPKSANAKQQVSAFAFRFKNHVRLAGLAQLGGAIVLTGSGMGFPWDSLRHMPLASGAIVEDMKLGIDLAIAGQPVRFCQEVSVVSQLPQQQQAAHSQRKRWEHGHLQSIGAYVPKLLRASLLQRRWDLFLMAWDLCIPPLSLLVMGWCLTYGLIVIVQFVAYRDTGESLASLPLWLNGLWLNGLAGVCLATAIGLSWLRVGQQELPLRNLLRVPLYIAAKIPLYLQFITHPQRTWNRTERSRDEPTLPQS